MIARSRALLARYVPPGAVMLAVLTFAAYGAGLVRDRIFARTYGAGPELDAYNAAFVLPELAARRPRRQRPDGAVRARVHDARPRRTRRRRPRFAQTVLTLAVARHGRDEPAAPARRPVDGPR